jgi:predicted nucleic acid-binding protein
MIGLDTNVLVRFLAQDDPVQLRIATDFIERRLTERDPGFASIIAITETASVLQRARGSLMPKSPERSSARCKPMSLSLKENRKSSQP